MITETNTSKLRFFSELYTEARAASEELYEKMRVYKEQYKGSADIDGSSVPASQIRNITYELIESQVTGYIPTPYVTPSVRNEKNERNAKSVEALLRAKRNELPFEKMNDLDERFSPIYGGSVWLVEWDDNIRSGESSGDVKVTCIAPHRFTGQPGIYELEDMEYCFITFETTAEDVERKYGVPVCDTDGETAELCVCYYRDESGRVCEYVWSGDTELSDISDFCSRKRKVCRICGQREGVCACEKPDFFFENEEYEVLSEDLMLADGTCIPKGTEIPFYRPTVFPIVIRKNTSDEDSLFGQSDCEFIRPQQQGINKLESRIMEKLMGGGVYPIVPKNASVELDGSIFKKVFRAEQKDRGLYGTVDLRTDVSCDAEASERLYDHAKRIIGISDSFLGQDENYSQSGKAKQMQIEQSAGRLNSKRKMKNAAYAEIDRLIFLYYLAYADEPRFSPREDAGGNWENVRFSRYDFLEKNGKGEYVYNDGYFFSADDTADLACSRKLLWEENRQNFASGAYGDPSLPQTRLIFWQNMERAHYPYAKENAQRLRDSMKTKDTP